MSRDRDRKLEQALKKEMRAAGTPAVDAHVDAETLAAWSEGGLDPVMMVSVESHVSNCARCQAIAGAVATSAPAAGPVVEQRRFRYWFLAPVAAGIAAVALWAIVPSPQQREVTVDQAKPIAVAPESSRAQAPASTPPSAESGRVETTPPPSPTPLAAPDRREQSADQLARSDAEVAAKAEAEVAGEPSRAAQSNTIPPAAAAPPPAPAPAAPSVAETALQKTLGFVPLEIISPDQNHRWRVVQTGVEFSMDRGNTWSPVRAVRDEIITGGTPVSGTILWLIGKAGVVLVTVDGTTFATVHLPVRVDVTSITATDARSASVTTADGRTFRTDDSGRNWREN